MAVGPSGRGPPGCGKAEPPPALRRCQLQHGEIQRLKRGTAEAIRRLDIVKGASAVRAEWLCMEVWAGHAAATMEAARTPGWTTTEPADILYGTDLRLPRERASVAHAIRELKPDLLILVPPRARRGRLGRTWPRTRRPSWPSSAGACPSGAP